MTTADGPEAFVAALRASAGARDATGRARCASGRSPRPPRRRTRRSGSACARSGSTRVPDVVIEQLNPAAIEVVRPLWLAMRAHHGSLTPDWGPVRDDDDSWTRRRTDYIKWLGEPDAFCLVAWRGDAAVGYALVTVNEGSATWPVGRFGYIESISVLPEERGGGDRHDAAARRRRSPRDARRLPRRADRGRREHGRAALLRARGLRGRVRHDAAAHAAWLITAPGTSTARAARAHIPRGQVEVRRRDRETERREVPPRQIQRVAPVTAQVVAHHAVALRDVRPAAALMPGRPVDVARRERRTAEELDPLAARVAEVDRDPPALRRAAVEIDLGLELAAAAPLVDEPPAAQVQLAAGGRALRT